MMQQAMPQNRRVLRGGMSTPRPPQKSPPIRIEFSTQTLIAIPLVVGAVWVFIHLWPIFIVLITALMLSTALNPFVEWLERRRFGRTAALAMVFSVCALVVAGLGLVSVPSLWAQVTQFLENLPKFQEQLADVLAERPMSKALAGTVRNFHLAQTATTTGVVSSVASMSLVAVEVAGYMATAVVLSIYFLADHVRMRGALYALVPKTFHLRLARLLLNLANIVGHYIRGQIITSAVIAIFVFGVLTACRVPNALALATFAGLTDVIPFVGALLATTPAVLAAYAERGGGVAAIVLFCLLAYQEFESRILVPRIYGSALRLPPVAVVVALLVGGKLGGIIGALLALPMAAGLLMAIEELRLDLPGDDTDDPQLRERDAQAERVYKQRTSGASAETAAEVAADIASEIEETDKSKTENPSEIPITGGTPRQ